MSKFHCPESCRSPEVTNLFRVQLPKSWHNSLRTHKDVPCIEHTHYHRCRSMATVRVIVRLIVMFVLHEAHIDCCQMLQDATPLRSRAALYLERLVSGSQTRRTNLILQRTRVWLSQTFQSCKTPVKHRPSKRCKAKPRKDWNSRLSASLTVAVELAAVMVRRKELLEPSVCLPPKPTGG